MNATGFPSPAKDYEKSRIDFNRMLRPFPASEFEFYVHGNALESNHILDKDMVIVDRRKSAYDGCMAVICRDGEFICRQLTFNREKKCYTYDYSGRTEIAMELFGIVTYQIRNVINGGFSDSAC